MLVAMSFGTRFLVSDTVKFVLSVGELGRHGWNTTLGTMPCLSLQRHSRRCEVVIQRPMDNCWRPKSTEIFGEWLALLGF